MNESSRWTEEEMETAKKGEPLIFFLWSALLELTQRWGRAASDRRVVGPQLWGQILPISVPVCSQQASGGVLGETRGGTGTMLSRSSPGSCADTRDIWAVSRARTCPARQEPAVGNGAGTSPVAFCSFWCV